MDEFSINNSIKTSNHRLSSTATAMFVCFQHSFTANLNEQHDLLETLRRNLIFTRAGLLAWVFGKCIGGRGLRVDVKSLVWQHPSQPLSFVLSFTWFGTPSKRREEKVLRFAKEFGKKMMAPDDVVHQVLASSMPSFLPSQPQSKLCTKEQERASSVSNMPTVYLPAILCSPQWIQRRIASIWWTCITCILYIDVLASFCSSCAAMPCI